jgi:hypothetical protein
MHTEFHITKLGRGLKREKKTLKTQLLPKESTNWRDKTLPQTKGRVERWKGPEVALHNQQCGLPISQM